MTKIHLEVLPSADLPLKEAVLSPLEDPTCFLPTGKPHVSYSEISDWLDCSERHRLKHVLKIALDKPSIHTEFGRAVHDALEGFISTRVLPDPAACKLKFEELCVKLFEEHGVKIEDKERDSFSVAIPSILASVPKFLDEEFPGWEGVEAEHALYESISGQDRKYFKGFIDSVIRFPKKKRTAKKPAPGGAMPMRLSEMTGNAPEGSNPDSDGWEYWIMDWKGQRLSAPILTPAGWTTMGELKIGDEISASDGKSCKVEGIFPLGMKDVYRVHIRDGTSIDTTDDHLWKVFDQHGKSKILTTKQLQDEKYYKYIPVPSNPIEFKSSAPLAIDPYLMGVLLGDGCLRSGVKISSADTQLLQNITPTLPPGVEIKKIGNSKYDYGLTVNGKGVNPRIHRNPILNSLRKIGLSDKLSHEKFIPESYLFASPEDRLSLIQGLLDTDGWAQKGIPKFSTTSPYLAKGMKDLVGSLGGVGFLSTRKTKRNPSEKTEYIVTVRLPEEMKPFRLDRKLKEWNPSPSYRLWRKVSKVELLATQDMMQCIGVSSPDHLYITNDFVLTHNTTSWGWAPEKKRDFQKHLQLALYKSFYCKVKNLSLDQVKCGFVLLKRTPRKSDGSCIELIPVSVGPKTEEKAIGVLNNMINQVASGRALKNRMSCRFCAYHGTSHCV